VALRQACGKTRPICTGRLTIRGSQASFLSDWKLPRRGPAAVEANVRWSVAQLAGLTGPKEAIRDSRIILAGAIYELRFLTK
jgi:hypothetical protein